MGKGRDGCVSLFETERANGRLMYRAVAASILVGIVWIWIYRASEIPRSGEDGRLRWMGLFGAELWLSFYWLLTQSTRWNLTFRYTFKDTLSQRYETELPGVDVFVCTADPVIEPPKMVINTVLSVMAYDYPAEKLSVYLSDDGGSELTFYALLEASLFSKHWIPFCKKFKVEPRCPAAYFASQHHLLRANAAAYLNNIKKLYTDMENRIETATKLGRIPEEVRSQYRGFSQWDSFSSPRNHDTILQIIIDGRDQAVLDVEGNALPTLVYLAREKRPQHHHNFKAGAMNALIRVSSELSNGHIILSVDCDMYSNDSQSVRDALCFFMDEEKGDEVAFVQFPQTFENITRNDVYGNSLRVIREVEFHGIDGYGGPLYVGTGCFHRRDTLCGRKFSKEIRGDWKRLNNNKKKEKSTKESEERLKNLASCTFEDNTQWGNEMGLKYGCPVEDVTTGLSIQCQGWKSIYFNRKRNGFLGVAGATLEQVLVQHKRWSQGDLQILLSKYSPLWYGLGKIHPCLLMGYCSYCFWAVNSLAIVYYSIVPSLYLLKGIPLFPKVSSPWFLPFAYLIVARYSCSLGEFLRAGGSALAWWNEQRIWLYKRTTSYLFAFVDTILGLIGFSELAFVISPKVSGEDVLQRYREEIMEFGSFSPMFTILATVAVLNLICLIGAVKQVGIKVFGTLALQILLCALLVAINLPLYKALFFRRDRGSMPSSVTFPSVLLAICASACFTFLY